MSEFIDSLTALEQEWKEPKLANHRGENTPFRLRCEMKKNLVKNHTSLNTELPDELIELYANYSELLLFTDDIYGQWGLEIFPASHIEIKTDIYKKDRRADHLDGDLVIGAFRGDSDILLVRCDQSSSDYGAVIIATPLDKRREWHAPAKSLSEFIKKYIASEGDKFWE